MMHAPSLAQLEAFHFATPHPAYVVQIDSADTSVNPPKCQYRTSWRAPFEVLAASDFEQATAEERKLTPGTYRFRVFRPSDGTTLCDYYMGVKAQDEG